MQKIIDISVIVPVYNVEKYLSECLDSILKQKGVEFEVICINDGSTDNSLHILSAYQEKNSKVKVYTTSNKGLSAARNYGIEKAEGEFLYCLDSDDMLADERALEIMVSQMKESRLDILYFDGVTLFEDKEMEELHIKFKEYFKRKREYGMYEKGVSFLAELIDEDDYFVNAGLQCLRRDFIEKNKLCFPEGLIYEDNYFKFVSLLAADRVKHINHDIYVHRVRNGSITTSKSTFYDFYSCYSIYRKMLFVWERFQDCYESGKHIEVILDRVEEGAMSHYYRLAHSEKQKIMQLKPCDAYQVKKWIQMQEAKHTYIFPYHLFERGDKVLIYGAGNIGKRFYLQAINENIVQISGIVDAKAHEMLEGEIEVSFISEILKFEYDYILIAVENESVANEIRDNLIEIGVLNEQIKWDGSVYHKKL